MIEELNNTRDEVENQTIELEELIEELNNTRDEVENRTIELEGVKVELKEVKEELNNFTAKFLVGICVAFGVLVVVMPLVLIAAVVKLVYIVNDLKAHIVEYTQLCLNAQTSIRIIENKNKADNPPT